MQTFTLVRDMTTAPREPWVTCHSCAGAKRGKRIAAAEASPRSALAVYVKDRRPSDCMHANAHRNLVAFGHHPAADGFVGQARERVFSRIRAYEMTNKRDASEIVAGASISIQPGPAVGRKTGSTAGKESSGFGKIGQQKSCITRGPRNRDLAHHPDEWLAIHDRIDSSAQGSATRRLTGGAPT